MRSMSDSMKKIPLVSLLLVTYQQERFIRETLASVLSQNYPNLQIIISDDCSKDNTFIIIQEVLHDYNGKHRNNIFATQNPSNLGICEHINSVIERCRGELIVVCAGDDIFFSNRVSEMVKAWKKTGASLLCSNAMVIDESGNQSENLYYNHRLKDKLYSLLDITSHSHGPFFGAGMAYTKNIFSRFGPLPIGLKNEDAQVMLRGVLLNGNYYISKPLLKYRIHHNNLNLWSSILQASSYKKAIYYFIEGRKRVIDNKSRWLNLLKLLLLDNTSNCNMKDINLAITSLTNVVSNLDLQKCLAENKLLRSRVFLFFHQLKFVRTLDLKNKLKIIILVMSPKLFIKLFVAKRKRV